MSGKIHLILAARSDSTFLRTICSSWVSWVNKEMDTLMDKNYVLNKILTLAYTKEVLIIHRFTLVWVLLNECPFPHYFFDNKDFLWKASLLIGLMWSKLDSSLYGSSHQNVGEVGGQIPTSLRSQPVLKFINPFLLSKCIFSIPAQPGLVTFQFKFSVPSLTPNCHFSLYLAGCLSLCTVLGLEPRGAL